MSLEFLFHNLQGREGGLRKNKSDKDSICQSEWQYLHLYTTAATIISTRTTTTTRPKGIKLQILGTLKHLNYIETHYM